MIEIDFTIKPKEIVPEYAVYSNGDKYLCDENGSFHSYNDLPAVILAGGAKQWYKHGVAHRENNLPACTWPDGRKSWYKDGGFVKEELP